MSTTRATKKVSVDKVNGTLPAQVYRGNNKKPNWSELDVLYQTIGTTIVGYASQVSELVEGVKLNLKEEIKPELAVLVNGFNTDIQGFTNDLLKIKADHADRKGDITKEDDICDYMDIGQRYNTFVELLEGTCLPTAHVITTLCINNASTEELITGVKDMAADIAEKVKQQ